MSSIRKYKTLDDARIDLYREMWERGCVKESLSEYFKKMKDSLEEKKIIKAQIYPPGVYPFNSFEDAEKDLIKRIKGV